MKPCNSINDLALTRQLITKAKDGDGEAIDQLVSLCRPFVFVICRSELGNSADVEDTTQAALIKLVVHIGQVKPEQPLGPWMGTVTSNLCRDVLRKQGRCLEISIDQTNDEVGYEPAAGLAQEPATAWNRSHAVELMEKYLPYCLERREPKHRLLLYFRYVLNIPANELHLVWPKERLPMWRVRSNLFKWLSDARTSLMRCLEAKGIGPEVAQNFLDARSKKDFLDYEHDTS